MTNYEPWPEPGEVLQFGRDGDRDYTFIGNQFDHITRDGRTVKLAQWSFPCVGCGTVFILNGFSRLPKNARQNCDECAPAAKSAHLEKMAEGLKKYHAKRRRA